MYTGQISMETEVLSLLLHLLKPAIKILANSLFKVDDYVYVAANSNLGFGVALSLGGGNLGPYLYFPFAGGCLRRGVRFADMTGDGRQV